MAPTTLTDLAVARNGSYYTIAGCGGDLADWTQGYEKLLKEEGIGTPIEWFTTSGAAVNEFARKARGGEIHPNDQYPLDLVFLLFPLNGLVISKLAFFKLGMQDRWFDDIIANMRVTS